MFDAGGAISTLGLDTSGFAGGFLQAEGLAHLFPAVVTDFMANPLLGFAELAKDAMEGVKAAIEGLGDITREIGDHFRDVGLAAQKAGVDVGWLSGLAGPAQAAGVGMDQLVTGFKTLEQRASEASEGQKAAVEGFQRLGISASEAAGLMERPQELFARVQTAIQGIEDPSQRTAAALGVLGRQGFNLVPLFAQSKVEADKLAGTMKELGATVSAEDAAMGQKFGQLETIVGGAWEGIKAAVAQPILQYVSEHFDEIVDSVKAVAGEMRETIGQLMPPIVAMIPTLIEMGSAVADIVVPAFRLLEPVLVAVGGLLQVLLEPIKLVSQGVRDILGDAGGLAGDSFGSGGGSSGGTSSGSGGRQGTSVSIDTIHVDPIDTNEATTQIANKLRQPINEAVTRQRADLEAAAAANRVNRSL